MTDAARATKSTRRRLVFSWAIAGALALSGCGSGTSTGTPGAGGSGGSGSSEPLDPGVKVQLTQNATSAAEQARVGDELSELDGLTPEAFAERFPAAQAAVPHYERATIAGLDKIQASSLALSATALESLDAQGFAISKQYLPSFTYGYQTLYLEDLPLYVSADSILNAVHLSYDSVLQALEQERLSADLKSLLAGMHGRLEQGVGQELGTGAVHDADLFLAVAQSLLEGREIAPVAGGSANEARKLTGLAEAAQGVASFDLFGVRRTDEDFSQFKPRGHYTDTPELTRYFKAMMWLGRIDLRLLETQPDGSQLFRRQQLEVTLLLRELIDADLRAAFDRIDRTIAAFVGEPDYMVLSEVDELASQLGISSPADVANIPDETLAQAIVDGGFGEQRISSHIMINGTADTSTLPLSRSFALLGQRYVVDSHVFSNVVYDRIGGRMMPNPLDVAFAALGNDRAGVLLERELTQYPDYPGALAKMRLLVDEHPDDYWSSSLYTLWMGSLRQLSPGADEGTGLFPVARTEAWQRRVLSAQLASWAELRHDTILYAKQSYSGGATCDFPDAYVDPYPGFFSALAGYGTRGTALIDELFADDTSQLVARVREHFTLVADVARRLQAMAEHERTGAQFTPEMLDFINDAVVVQNVCGGGTFESGWYKQLFFDPSKALEVDPTIADVHTQPTDEAGNFVGHVLHVGTGAPRVMVVVAEGCSGPHAYAGLVSSYREAITDDFERLDDPTWATQWQDVPEVPWMTGLISK